MRYIIWLTHGESVQVNDLDLATEGRWIALRNGVVIGTGSDLDDEDEECDEQKELSECFQKTLARKTPQERDQIRQSLKQNIIFTEESFREDQNALKDYTQRLDYLNLMYGTGRNHYEE